MEIEQIYNLAVKMGIEADFRDKSRIKKILAQEKKKYEELDESEEEFDKERLTNPYSDTRILNVGKKEVKRVLAGIDIDTAELMLANELGGIDLVFSHHPIGMALADLSGVMHLQADVLHQYGVPINVAEGVLKSRISEVARGVSGSNHNKAVWAARLLKLSLMCVHTPCDNLVVRFVDKKIKKDKPETVGEVLKSLRKIPEYKEAAKFNAGPRLFTGEEGNRTGKIALTEITGGAEGSPKIYEKMAQAGIGTVISMHMSEEHKREAEAAHINVVSAGHISSDSIGVNLFLDRLEQEGVKITPCSGLIRISRN